MILYTCRKLKKFLKIKKNKVVRVVSETELQDMQLMFIDTDVLIVGLMCN